MSVNNRQTKTTVGTFGKEIVPTASIPFILDAMLQITTPSCGCNRSCNL